MKDMEEEEGGRERKRRMPEFCDPDIAFLRALRQIGPPEKNNTSIESLYGQV